MDKKYKTCCFIGHRKIEITDELYFKVEQFIKNLIENENAKVFLFGNKSLFNDLCLTAVCNLKEKYPCIQRIYVRANYEYIREEYKNYLIEGNYDDTYFPEKISGAGKSIYLERNKHMVDKSDICVFYYNKTYIPPKKKYAKRCISFYQPNSGTAIAYKYAIWKNKKAFNLYETTL